MTTLVALLVLKRMLLIDYSFTVIRGYQSSGMIVRASQTDTDSATYDEFDCALFSPSFFLFVGVWKKQRAAEGPRLHDESDDLTPLGPCCGDIVMEMLGKPTKMRARRRRDTATHPLNTQYTVSNGSFLCSLRSFVEQKRTPRQLHNYHITTILCRSFVRKSRFTCYDR